MIYFCRKDARRELIRKPGQPLNGIDRIEVLDAHFDTPAQQDKRQRFLRLFFVKPPEDHAPCRLLTALTNGTFDVCLVGGERITGIRVKQAVFQPAQAGLDAHVAVEVDQRGDGSTYTLRLCEPGGGNPNHSTFTPLAGLDERLASVDFSFKVECPGDLDCRQVRALPPEVRVEPELDYLAKDFNSFRQLLLDRLALIAPGWTERNPCDLGITLVELLAYVGDYLSYRQDAVGTEAYLGTARQRVSFRRHARLLDYPMHEGCNARAWVQVRLKDAAGPAGAILPRNRALLEMDSRKLAVGTCFSTDAGVPLVLATDADELVRILDSRAPDVFEPLHDVFLHPDHNEMNFYTWAGAQCCLPKGAVKATLEGGHPALQPGHVLIFQERIGPRTGDTADADPHKRHAVRLTAVNPGTDPLDKTPDGKDLPVTGIQWHEADALPFPLCLSSVDEQGEPVDRVSVALGNLVLADQGYTLPARDDLGGVPAPDPALAPVADHACGQCESEVPREAPSRFSPRISRAGLTHSQALPKSFDTSPATLAQAQDPRKALPAIRLGDERGNVWNPQRDLIASDATAREFVVEIDNDGHARIRFGDDTNGMRPAENTHFYARYRIGNGAGGNVGAGAITQVFAPVFLDPVTRLPIAATASGIIESVTNPLAAWAGKNPEPLEDVRQYAPRAFQEPRRCVTPEDYARRAGEHPEVQRAAATLRWTGSWHTLFLTVDRRRGQPVTPAFEAELLAWLESYRLAGQDLEIDRPIFVSIELSLFVGVDDGYFRADVRAALLDVFSAGQRPDGSRGFFHPDNFTFGDPVRVSAIYAAAQAVAGVRRVEVRALRRQGATTGPDVPVNGVFTTGRLEIVRLENNPDFSDHGILKLQLRGGR